MLSFKKPDLAVAFNSGASEGVMGFSGSCDRDTPWMGLMKFVVSRKIPCLFTVRVIRSKLLFGYSYLYSRITNTKPEWKPTCLQRLVQTCTQSWVL